MKIEERLIGDMTIKEFCEARTLYFQLTNYEETDEGVPYLLTKYKGFSKQLAEALDLALDHIEGVVRM